MTVLALYNLKGGVGKTAAAVNLAYLSAAEGYKTLVWDLDSQGSSSFYLHVQPNNKNESKKIFESDLDIQDTVQDSLFENLWVIPADMSARQVDISLNELKNSKKKIKSLLSGLKGFDVVILDCPPGISLLHENIFYAADRILLPNIPTTLSINSLDKVMEYFDSNGLDKSKLKSFFSMVDHRKNLHLEVMQQFYRDKLFLKSYIPYLSEVEKMGVYRQPLFEFANSGYAARCYRDLWHEIKKAGL
jgi:cellulose biosynthesis protein BcsQ